jgi:hypothetical protein
MRRPIGCQMLEKRRTPRGLPLVITLILVTPGCHIQNVTRIVIKSMHIGWAGLDGADRLEITCEGQTCVARGQRIPMRHVTALLNVLAAPPLQPELTNLDITQEWLNENVASGLEASVCRFTPQRALFVSTFTNLQEVKALLPRVLEPGATDDSPSVEIEILRNGETVWQLVSSSQSHAFMLPWVVIASEKSFFTLPWSHTQPDKSFITYNADISRALIRLLPEKFVNYDRIAGAHLNRELGFMMGTRLQCMDWIRSELIKRKKRFEK